MNFPKILEKFTKCLILKILKKERKEKPCPSLNCWLCFWVICFYVFLFYLMWFGWVVKAWQLTIVWSHDDYLDFWDQNVKVLGSSFTLFDKFSHSPMQACTGKLTRNCLAIDWAPVNLFTIDKKVLIKAELACLF